MAKFAIKRPAWSRVSSPVTSVEHARTHEGGAGFARDAKSELFLLAVANLVGEDTFYEQASERDRRFAALVHQVTLEDAEWVARFVPYLRGELNLRSAAVVMAAESAKARIDGGITSDTSTRRLIGSALVRADEPAELLAYWQSRFGRNLPAGVKRGVADAAVRLFDERAAVKYDGTGNAWRLGDVIDVVHPQPATDAQSALFKYLLDRRHGRTDLATGEAALPIIAARRALEAIEVDERRAAVLGADDPGGVLRSAGATWEWLSGYLQGPMDAAAWEAMIPSMGYMALLRNLRNFDQAGVSDTVARDIAAKLADPARVARSRQMPMRFLAAYRAAPSLRWSWPLEQALQHSLSAVPALPGRTLVLVDTSGSMQTGFSRDGTVKRWDAAVGFGLAIAGRCETADVVSFSGGGYRAESKPFPTTRGASLLSEITRWGEGGWFIGGGTDTAGAVRRHYGGHDRVVILTDEQAHDGTVGSAVPASVSLYTWNLAGYRVGHAESGAARRHTFGGLTDAAFRQIPLIEAGESADWPF